MLLILQTIPRTGTGFFLKVLSQHFQLTSPRAKKGLAVSHVSEAGLDLLTSLSYPHLVLTTWRDWEKVRESFTRYGDATFEEQFVIWERLVSLHDPIVLTVEREYCGVTREEILLSLGNRLGVCFDTDWKPVKSGEGR